MIFLLSIANTIAVIPRIITVLNKNTEKQNVELTIPAVYNVTKVKNLLNGEEFDIDNGTLSLVTDGIDYLILKVYWKNRLSGS